MSSHEHTHPAPRRQSQPRIDRIREVRRKVAQGAYDRDREALEATVDRFIARELERRHREMLAEWFEAR